MKELLEKHVDKVTDCIISVLCDAEQLGPEALAGTIGAMAKAIGYTIGASVPTWDQPNMLNMAMKALPNGVIEGKLARGDKDTLIVIAQEVNCSNDR